MTTTATMLPYRRQGEIDYDSLEFDPNEPVLKPDAMEQNLELLEIIELLRAYLTDFGRRPDIFLDYNTIVCYDPSNLNVRVSPDVYIVFGVDAKAIRPRKIYLPWEVGKPPDWVLEIASSSTGAEDIGRKRIIYAEVGVPEYWRFDPTGGNYHDVPLAGERLVDGVYEPIPLTTEPDGILKGYSPVLGYSLCWDNGWPKLYDPKTSSYLENWRAVEAGREAAEAQVAVEQADREAAEAQVAIEQAGRETVEARAAAEQTRREAAEAEVERLMNRLRQLQPDEYGNCE